MKLYRSSNIDHFAGLQLLFFLQNIFSMFFSIKVKTFEITVYTKNR